MRATRQRWSGVAAAAEGRRFARFLLVGVFATGVHYAVLVALVELLGTNPTVAATIGFTAGAIVSYVSNYGFTFAATVPHRRAAPRFAMTALGGGLINTVIMAALTEGLGVYYLAAQVVATAAAFLWNYVVNARWSFERGAALGPLEK